MKRQIEISDFKTFIIIRSVFFFFYCIMLLVVIRAVKEVNRNIHKALKRKVRSKPKKSRICQEMRCLWFISEIVLRALEFN